MALPIVEFRSWMLLTFVLVFGLTEGLIRIAYRYGWLCYPKSDRWHKSPTALYGGVALYLGFILALAPLWNKLGCSTTSEWWPLIMGASLLFLVGLWDDIRPLNPVVKLLAQVMIISIFVAGIGLDHTQQTFIIAIPLVMFWVLGLVNAYNLLDNMDGLAGGTVLITSGVLAVILGAEHVMPGAVMAALLCCVCGAFLCFNYRPGGAARIFMGDCGSMFLGFLVAGLAVIAARRALPDFGRATLVPVLLMAVPIFDTTFVTINRKLEGRAISQGGRDHTSHRLVYAGLAEKHSVFVLYLLNVLCSGVALLIWFTASPALSLVALILIPAILVWLGAYLSRFRPSGIHMERNAAA